MAGNKDNVKQAMKELFGSKAVETEAPVQQEVPVSYSSAAPRYNPEPAPLSDRQMDDLFPEYDNADSVKPLHISFGTVIADGSVFTGDIRAEGDVDVRGVLKGNLVTSGSIRVSGKVVGDIRGGSVSLQSCAVKGCIDAEAVVTMDAGTLVIGDVTAGELTSDGKIKGNVMISSMAVFQSNAVLAGNVTAGRVSMCAGAKIHGVARISQDDEVSGFFNENLDI